MKKQKLISDELIVPKKKKMTEFYFTYHKKARKILFSDSITNFFVGKCLQFHSIFLASNIIIKILIYSCAEKFRFEIINFFSK